MKNIKAAQLMAKRRAQQAKLEAGSEGAPKTKSAANLNPQEQEALIRKLALLPDLELFRRLAENALRLGIPTNKLERLVQQARQQEKEKQKATDQKDDMFPAVEPWDEEVDGAELLNDIIKLIRRFTVLSLFQTLAVALWIMFTWLIDHASVAPLLNITSPEPGCGKSTLGTLIKELVFRPLYASNITPAALFRTIEMHRPTLVIDEADTFLAKSEEMRGIINAGHYRSTAYVIRIVGELLEPLRFKTWGAKVLIGIGKLAHTLHDRSIVIQLRRKLESEHVDNLRHADEAAFEPIKRKLARWSQDNCERFSKTHPAPIQGLQNRAMDNWEPLLAIAELAGDKWPARCRRAAAELSVQETAEPSVNALLLADIRSILRREQSDRVSTEDLLSALCEDDEAPWATWNRGKPISARQLATHLRAFGIVSGSIRFTRNKTAKGYHAEKFEDAFQRYLKDTPEDADNNGTEVLLLDGE